MEKKMAKENTIDEDDARIIRLSRDSEHIGIALSLFSDNFRHFGRAIYAIRFWLAIFGICILVLGACVYNMHEKLTELRMEISVMKTNADLIPIKVIPNIKPDVKPLPLPKPDPTIGIPIGSKEPLTANNNKK